MTSTLGVTGLVNATGLRTDLTDDTICAGVHADQHNQVNALVLSWQAGGGPPGGGGGGGSTDGSLVIIGTDPMEIPLTIQGAPGQANNLLMLTDPTGLTDLAWFTKDGTLIFNNPSLTSADLAIGSVMQGSISGLMMTQSPLLSTSWLGFGFYDPMIGNQTDPYGSGQAFSTGNANDNGNSRFSFDSNGAFSWYSYDQAGVTWGNPDVVMSHGQSISNGYGTQGLRIMGGDWLPNVPVLSIIARGSTIHNWRNFNTSFGRQAGDLLRIQDGESGDIWATFDAEGRLSLTPNNPAFNPFTIRAVYGQTGDLLQIQDNNSNPVISVTGPMTAPGPNALNVPGALKFTHPSVSGSAPAYLYYGVDGNGSLEIPTWQNFSFGDMGAAIYGGNNFDLYLGSGGGDIYMTGGATVRMDGRASIYWQLALGDDPTTIFGPNPSGNMIFMGQAGTAPAPPSWGATLYVDPTTNRLMAVGSSGTRTVLAQP